MEALKLTTLAVVLASMAATAQAGIKASAVTYAGVSTVSPEQALVRLDASGATTLGFTLPAAGTKVLTFSAECTVDSLAGDSLSWTDLDIVVNGGVVAPTIGSDDAFCSAHGASGIKDDHVRASITIPIQGRAGSNTVQIKARGNYNAKGFRLANIALVVFD